MKYDLSGEVIGVKKVDNKSAHIKMVALNIRLHHDDGLRSRIFHCLHATEAPSAPDAHPIPAHTHATHSAQKDTETANNSSRKHTNRPATHLAGWLSRAHPAALIRVLLGAVVGWLLYLPSGAAPLPTASSLTSGVLGGQGTSQARQLLCAGQTAAQRRQPLA